MEGSTSFLETPARSDPGTIRVTQIGLVLAAIGALFVVFGVIPTAGLVMTVVGAVLAARGGIGHGWYTAIAAGAALEVIAKLLADGSSETLGGWLAVIASLVILVAVSLGYPTNPRS